MKKAKRKAPAQRPTPAQLHPQGNPWIRGEAVTVVDYSDPAEEEEAFSGFAAAERMEEDPSVCHGFEALEEQLSGEGGPPPVGVQRLPLRQRQVFPLI